MNTFEPISKVSGCLQITPRPILHAVAKAARQRAPDGPAHHRVELALAVTQPPVQLEQRPRLVARDRMASASSRSNGGSGTTARRP